MEKLVKCTVCGYVHQGDAPDKCPKCGVSADKFITLTEEQTKKLYDADRTNDIHAEIMSLSMAIADLAIEGIEIDLDPGCTKLFKQALDEAWVIKQRSKAELEGHMKKEKF